MFAYNRYAEVWLKQRRFISFQTIPCSYDYVSIRETVFSLVGLIIKVMQPCPKIRL